VLPPFFILKVPGFGVAAKVKRVWVAAPGQGSVWCGGIIERQADRSAATPWQTFVASAPGAADIQIRAEVGDLINPRQAHWR
jgi:hypothetical protein